jgi:5-methylcytosine-specific restriction endonuclease McrA
VNSNKTNRYGSHKNRRAYEQNKKQILKTHEKCAICGNIVDKKYRYPHPFSATIDHIIPISKGGSIIDINNLQLAHNFCNRKKWDTLINKKVADVDDTLQLSRDWNEWVNKK